MRERHGATLYLFGSRARGTAGPYSDYDLVAVSPSFRAEKPTARVTDRLQLWYEAGGWGQGLDLHCYTPEEFREETRDGFGYLGQAKRRRELIVVRPCVGMHFALTSAHCT
mgnify:CR=1 FL=1